MTVSTIILRFLYLTKKKKHYFLRFVRGMTEDFRELNVGRYTNEDG